MDPTGKWTVGNAEGTITAPAHGPGCIHIDLESAGHSSDPYYRDNESRLQWIGRSDWVYEHTFQVTETLRTARGVILRCEGLDTLSEIRLNGTLLGKTDNMFRTWEFDAKKTLTIGEQSVALWCRLFLENSEARFSNNFFHISPRNSVSVDIVTKEKKSLRKMESLIKMESLVDLY